MTAWDVSHTVGRSVGRIARAYPLPTFIVVAFTAMILLFQWQDYRDQRYRNSPQGRAEQAAKDAAAKAASDQKFMQDMQEVDLAGVKASLRDPESAQFTGVHSFQRNGKRVTCGFVNSKNGFGGMAGLTAFSVVDFGVSIASIGPIAAKEVRAACG